MDYDKLSLSTVDITDILDQKNTQFGSTLTLNTMEIDSLDALDSIDAFIPEPATPIVPDFLNVSESPECPPSSSSGSDSSTNSLETTNGTGQVSVQEDGPPIVVVSTVFYPGAKIHTQPFDMAIISCDKVFFYVHTEKLKAVSENEFKGLLLTTTRDEPKSTTTPTPDSPPVRTVSESSTVFNIVLHAVYNLPCDVYSPTLDDIEKALKALQKYGVSLKDRVNPSSNLFRTLLTIAHPEPLLLYALAASLKMHELCVSISPLLLSCPLTAISDDLSKKMGSIYLKNIFKLHLDRIATLKSLLIPPPSPHAPSSKCDYIAQKQLTRSWALACAYLTWDARPDIGRETIDPAFSSLAEQLTCSLCKKALRERVKDLLISWSLAKKTI